MPRPAKPWRVFQRAGSPTWKVQWGGRYAPYEALEVARERPRKEAEEEAARRWLKRVESGARGPKPAPGALADLSLPELVIDYIEHVERTYTGNDGRYASRKSTDLTEYVVPRWKTPREVTAEGWKAAMLELHHSRGGPLKWRSIVHLALTLRGFLEWCRGRGLIDAVPEIEAPTSQQVRLDAAPREAMTEEGREKFLEALLRLGERRAWRIYTVLFETWQRKSCVERMPQRWLNFMRETITIPPGAMKNKEPVTIDLTPRAAAAIREQLEENAEKREPGAPVPLDEPIFGKFDFHQARTRKKRNEQGELVEVEDGGVFGRALRLAGIDGHGLVPHHSARHTAATLAAEKPGASLAALMAQGAWRNPTIPGRYMHPTLKAARSVTRASSSPSTPAPKKGDGVS